MSLTGLKKNILDLVITEAIKLTVTYEVIRKDT